MASFLDQLEAAEKSLDSNEDVDQIITQIAANASDLTTLSLVYKNLDEVQMKAIFSALRTNNTITEISLLGNKISEDSIIAFCLMILENKTIEKVDLSYCEITDHMANYLVGALSTRDTPCALKAKFNSMSPDVDKQLSAFAKSKRSKAEPTFESLAIKQLLEASVKRNSLLEMQKAEFEKQFDKSMRTEKKKKTEQAKKKKCKINLQNIQINEQVAESGEAGLYSCLVDGWLCCMKEMELEGVNDNSLAAFDTEVVLLEKLPYHPNIVRYLFHEKRENKVRLFMTKYSCTLKGFLLRRRFDMASKNASLFTPLEIAKWAAQIVAGLEFLHKAHVLHRNVKPETILCSLDAKGQVQNLAITDFDSAKQITKRVQAKTAIGTMSYAAPEVIKSENTKQYNHKADVWSFGMTLYEMITLMIPYEDHQDKFQIPHLITAGKPPTTSHIPTSYDPLLKVLKDCIQLDPDQRPEMKTLKERFQQLTYEYSQLEITEQ